MPKWFDTGSEGPYTTKEKLYDILRYILPFLLIVGLLYLAIFIWSLR